MTGVRAVTRIRWSLVGGILAASSIVAMLVAKGRRRRRPSAADLLRLDDAGFTEFIRAAGLRTDVANGTVPVDGARA